MKTLRTLFKQDKEKFVVPKSVQTVIPIKTIWEDGIFLVGKNKYAKTFKFEDINYAVASRDDKEAKEEIHSLARNGFFLYIVVYLIGGHAPKIVGFKVHLHDLFLLDAGFP